jgi:hypothetical protein
MEKKVSEYEYNAETVDYWKWNQIFIIVNTLKGGGYTDFTAIGKEIWDFLMNTTFSKNKTFFEGELEKEVRIVIS